ncbi:MAG: DDE-type integrase/transposase/recombinase [Nitrososphaerales archaeon]|nr:DDE-type integrase/transposase/recombinase [Nitrososphaerales archaeon]
MDTRAKLLEVRAVKGNQIAQTVGRVRRISEGEYAVHSQRSDDWYQVVATEAGFNCSCPDFTNRAIKCKHIFAVEFSHVLRQTVEQQVKIEPLDIQSCLYCYSKSIIKRGVRHNKNGDIQRFLCHDCGKRFTKNLGFEGMKASPQMITSALQLYFTGESLRNTQKFLALQGVQVSHQTIHNWIRKYVGLMEKYLDQIQPNLSPTWRADELWIKVKGDMKYLFAMMDDQTRFWIAQEVADSKEKHDARTLFHRSAEVAGTRPRLLITDGLRSYNDAFKREYTTHFTSTNPIHVREIAITGRMHNNKMERMNGEVRDREKVMRGLKTTDSPILKGYQLFHNYIRPHEALDGDTPADRCGIKVEGSNKWLTIIQNASKVPRLDSETKTRENPQT